MDEKRSKQPRAVFPEFVSQATVRGYLENFLDVNRQVDRRFSTRFFSGKLAWPRSLLTDVVKGRKRLSVQRAVEFCEFAEFSERRTQLFVLKAICEDEDSKVVRFLDRFIACNFRSFVTEAQPQELQENIFSDALSSIVVRLVEARPGIEPSQMETLLDTFPDWHLEQLGPVLDLLTNTGLIEPSARGFVAVDRAPFVCDHVPGQPVRWTPKSYAENLVRFIELARPSSTVQGATITLPLDRFPEVRERLAEVRNWLLAISAECKEERKLRTGDSVPAVIQVVLAAFTVHPG